MDKLILYALVGGAAYWVLFMQKPAVVPPQNQMTVVPTPEQMAPTVQGAPNYYNVDAFPMGTFTER